MSTTTTVTTTYLAQRAYRTHADVRRSAENAIRRGAAAEFSPCRVLTTNRRRVAAFNVTAEGAREMARGARMAGQIGTALAYETVAAELETGTVAPLETTQVQGVEVLAPNARASVKDARQTELRRARELDAEPVAEMIAARGYVEQIDVARWLGTWTTHLRRSVGNLPADVLAADTIAATREVRVGLRRTTILTLPVRLLSAEALDAMADNFALSGRLAGRNREGRIRQLAARLRAFEAEHRHAAACPPSSQRKSNMTDTNKTTIAATADRPKGRGASLFRGVSPREFPSGKRYRAALHARGRGEHIGWFPTELEAAQAYDRIAAARGLHDRVNFPTALPEVAAK